MPIDHALLNDIIRRLLSARNGRSTKQVNLTEAEIRKLCAASKEIFLSQPNLLGLEAPIKICAESLNVKEMRLKTKKGKKLIAI